LKKAFFFQGDSLILPHGVSGSKIPAEVPLELSAEFNDPDIFEIPSLIDPASPIKGVFVSSREKLPDNWKSIPVRRLLASDVIIFSASLEDIIRAYHIAQWRQESRFCGSCGAQNSDVFVDSASLAQRLCPKCGRMEFPRICPAVITAVTDDENRILLAHNKKFRAGVYSLISGFTEAGETLEETVVREIREEVNIEVKNIEYVKSQPWPFPNSLMLGYKARYMSGELKPDGEEIEDAAWFTKDNLPELPAEGSLSRFLINNWLENF